MGPILPERTGDGSIIEFRSVVDAVRCAIEVQNGMIERNSGLPPERRIRFRVGIHLGDVVEESDGDLMGDGVNIAARLQGLADPGGVCLSEDAYRQVRDRIGEGFVDLGEKALKNIARPMRVYALQSDRAIAPPEARPETSDRTVAPRLSIVILPFANLGGDPEQEYFADGVTECLTTDLSRIAGAFVIARNTAFTYKGKPFDLKTIGRELNVRYMLEGSVQRVGSRMRVNVQLIDSESGKHLWAERFDKPVADFFDMQDEIVARLAGQLGAELIAAEARRAEKAPNPDAFDLYLQGMAWFNKGPRPVNLVRARTFFRRALEIEPDNVDALTGGASAEFMEVADFATVERAARLAGAESSLLKALSAAPDNAIAHLWLSWVKTYSNRAAQGIAEAERALALNRNLAPALPAMGIAKLFAGHAEEMEGYVRQALRLSPREPFAFGWMAFAGGAKLHLGDYEAAAEWLSESVTAYPNFPLARFFLAAALGQLGQGQEARAQAEAGLALNPAFTVAHFRDGAESDNAMFLEQRHNIYDGLRKAGGAGGMSDERSSDVRREMGAGFVPSAEGTQ